MTRETGRILGTIIMEKYGGYCEEGAGYEGGVEGPQICTDLTGTNVVDVCVILIR